MVVTIYWIDGIHRDNYIPFYSHRLGESSPFDRYNYWIKLDISLNPMGIYSNSYSILFPMVGISIYEYIPNWIQYILFPIKPYGNIFPIGYIIKPYRDVIIYGVITMNDRASRRAESSRYERYIEARTLWEHLLRDPWRSERATRFVALLMNWWENPAW